MRSPQRRGDNGPNPMRNVSSHRFQHAAALLSECDDLIRALHEGKPTTALSKAELEAAGKLADHCYSIIWTLCDSARLNMDDELNPNELMANLWRDDPHSPVTLMGTLWTPREAG